MTRVARLRLGTAQLGMRYGIANRTGLPSAAEADRILATALDVGIRALDTAEAYGLAEARIGSFLAKRRGADAFTISSKLPKLDLERDSGTVETSVARAIEGSLRRLGVERIDEYLVHDASDLRRHGRALVEALARQRDRGTIARIGVSLYGPSEIALALEHVEISVVQHPLNLLDRRLVTSGLLAELRKRGIAVHARSPFLQGLLRLAPEDVPERMAWARPSLEDLRGVLAEWSVVPGDLALAFAASHEGVDCVVAGAETAEQVRENAAAIDRRLPPGLAGALRRRRTMAAIDVVDPTRWPREAS
jgi:aryl-alcohol dehydrogenase-like predicted oxidoreductase